MPPLPARIEVRKTYKLYIGGAFPRTESGRSYLVSAADGTPLANACRASRKDVRDAVRAARKAFPGWAARTAMNRGQVLYRVAELMEGRREQFVDRGRGRRGAPAGRRPDGRRPGHRPLGLVRRLGRQDRPGPRLVEPGRRARTSTSRSPNRPASSASSPPRPRRCSGLVSRLAPPLVTGNAVVARSPARRRPLPAVTLTEVLATSDVPGGVVNVLTGRTRGARAGPRRVTTTSTRSTRGASPTTMRTRDRARSPPTTSSASRAARRRSPKPASTGSTTPPPNVPNGSPPSSR